MTQARADGQPPALYPVLAYPQASSSAAAVINGAEDRVLQLSNSTPATAKANTTFIEPSIREPLGVWNAISGA